MGRTGRMGMRVRVGYGEFQNRSKGQKVELGTGMRNKTGAFAMRMGQGGNQGRALGNCYGEIKLGFWYRVA